MKENEAIEVLKDFNKCAVAKADGAYETNDFIHARDIAIKALEELQMYKQGKLCLIPTYVFKKQCEELDAFKETGTVKELQTAMKYMSLAKKHGTVGKAIDACAEYEALGTLEELKVLKEKSKPKKVIFAKNLMTKEQVCHCPFCRRIVESVHIHCWNCGQAIDWQ